MKYNTARTSKGFLLLTLSFSRSVCRDERPDSASNDELVGYSNRMYLICSISNSSLERVVAKGSAESQTL
jgi:hypothetical protein